MCNPAALAAVVTIAGTAASVGTQVKAAGDARRAAARQKQLGAVRAADALDRGRQAKRDRLDEIRVLLGRQRAQTAAGNIALDVGTPAILDAETIAIGEAEAARIEENARREALGISFEANARASESRSAARRFVGGAVGSGLQGVGQTLSIVGANPKSFEGIAKYLNSKPNYVKNFEKRAG